MVIDVHTHAFPDDLAPRAMAQLESETDVFSPIHDGTLGGLLTSMDEAGVDVSVVASIATKPGQFRPILEWSRAVVSERIIPFASIHPRSERMNEEVAAVAAADIKGVKLHPYYQSVALDDPASLALCEAVAEAGLPLLCHCGFDPAFPYERIADPARVAALAEALPDLKLIAAHLGGWRDWREAARHVIGRDVYLDISACLPFLRPDTARNLLLAHPPERLLFGSDSPWDEPGRALRDLDALGLPAGLREAIRWRNAAKLLGLPLKAEHLRA